MKKVKLVYILLLFFSCDNSTSNNHENTLESPTVSAIKKALKNGFYSQINSEIGLLVDQDNIYYFNRSKSGFTDDKFMLHLINEDGSFKNVDFFKDKFVLADSAKGLFKNVSIIHRQINLDRYTQIRTGQFKRDSLVGSNSNTWSYQTTLKNIINREKTYENQLQESVNLNLIQENFSESLKRGKFFAINQEFYLLLNENELYVLTDKSSPLDDKFMLHLIQEDDTFKNLSFDFKNKEYSQFLEKEFKQLRIAKINIDLYENYYEKIRIGQYNSKGNLWAQTIVLDEIYENELLKYKNEFKKMASK